MFCFVFTTRSSITQAVLKLNITKNSLEFLILLLQPPECWNSSCVPLGLANGFAGSMPHWQTLCPLRPLSSPNEHLQMVKEKLIFLMRQMKMVLLPFALIMFPAPLPSSLRPVIQEAHCCLRMRRTCSSTSGSWPSPWLLQRSAFL